MRRLFSAGMIASTFAVALLAGCTTNFPDISVPVSSPSRSSATTAPSPLTCDDIVPPEDVAKYADAGWIEAQSYVDQLTELDDPLSAFLDHDGALCAWGVPASDHVTVMGAGPIDDATAATQKKRLEQAGFARTEHNGAELYRLAKDYGEDDYLFVAGHWFYGSDLATADRVRLRADVG
jgi:hypothetical protein